MPDSNTLQDDAEISWSELLFGRSNTVWFLVVAVGFLLFELTAQRALVAVAVCSKFGIGDFLNGFWLRRTDPLRARGKSCFWLCLSQGLWKTTIVAFIAMVMFVLLAKVFNAGGRAPDGFVGTAMTFLVAFILASLTTVLAVVIARIGGVLIWVDGNLTQCRREKTFPPEEGSSNRVRWLLAGAMILPVVIFLIMTLIVAGRRPGAVKNAVGLLIGLLLLPASIFGGGLLVAKGVVASTFDECWSAETRRRGLTLEDVAREEGILPNENGTTKSGPVDVS
ncbi:MAG: hypothetical protein AB8G99_08825 [Planctomycetaceae bacterium]